MYDNLFVRNFHYKITKLAGTLTYKARGESGKLFVNGNEIKGTNINGEYIVTYTFDGMEEGSDSIRVEQNNLQYMVKLDIDFDNTELSINVPVNFAADTVIESYQFGMGNIHNGRLTIAELYSQLSSESFDIFSVHNRVSDLEREIIKMSRQLYINDLQIQDLQ